MLTKWDIAGDDVKVTCFRDDGSGVLYFEGLESKELEFAITPWQKGLELYKKVGFDWVEELLPPEISLIPSKGMNKFHPEITRFVQDIPQSIASVAGQFRLRQLAFLRAVKISKIARELQTESPILLWKLVNYLSTNSMPVERINSFQRMKRLEIIEMIYGQFPKSLLRSMDRFLRKITVHNADSIDMTMIDIAVKSSKTLKKMGSLDTISSKMLERLLSHPEYLSCPWVFKCSEIGHPWEEVYRVWKDALLAAQLLHIPNARKTLKQCKDIWELHSIHDQWTYDVSEHIALLEGDNKPFPDPPIPGTPGIIPIKKPSELVLEGREMAHCVFIHSQAIYSGYIYVYRILNPVRGTLMLQNKVGLWDIEEFRLSRNQSPSKESWDCVKDWYEHYVGSLERTDAK